MIMVPVMDCQLFQALAREFASATAADVWEQAERSLAIALLPNLQVAAEVPRGSGSVSQE